MTVNPSPFDVDLAARQWAEGDTKRKSFALTVKNAGQDYVAGQVKELASKIRRSKATIYSYARAARLFEALSQDDNSRAEIAWDKYDISFFVTLADKWSSGQLTIERVWDWLVRVLDEDMSVDDMRAEMPTNGGRVGIVRKLGGVLRLVQSALTSETMGLNCKQEEYREWRKRAEDFAEYTRRILAASGGTPDNTNGVGNG